MKTIVTYKTYDLFHLGHYNILERAKEYLELIYGKNYMTPKKDGYKKIYKKGEEN